MRWVRAAAAAEEEPPVRHFSRQNEETWKLQSVHTVLSSLLSVSCTISAPLPAGSNDDEHDSRVLQTPPHTRLLVVSGAGFTNLSAASWGGGGGGVQTLTPHTHTPRMHTLSSLPTMSLFRSTPPTSSSSSSWGVVPKAVAKEMIFSVLHCGTLSPLWETTNWGSCNPPQAIERLLQGQYVGETWGVCKMVDTSLLELF